MTSELKQEDLEQIQKMSKEAGIVPVNNPTGEDLWMKELERLWILRKDLEKDWRYSSLTEVVTYLTGWTLCFINILGSTVQRCKVAYGFRKEKRKSVPCKIRIDIHSGSLIKAKSGITFDIWGDAINISSHLESTSVPGEIHISEETRDYLEGLGQLTSRGEISLRGKGGWSTFFLESFNSWE